MNKSILLTGTIIFSQSLLLTGISGCHNVKASCFRDQFINHEFKEISQFTQDVNATCLFTDINHHVTYENGAFLAEAEVIWRSCTEYDLIVRKANYTGGVKVGDTVKVKIHSQNADTFYYEASAYGVTLSAKLKRIK